MARPTKTADPLILVAAITLAVSRADAFDPQDVQHFRETGYRSCQACDLARADLRGIEMSTANLEGARLDEALLEGARLNEANLKRVNLVKANLEGASLHKASLQRASLFGVRLTSADLKEANLESADLREANLESADLLGASLAGANLRGASLAGADMSGVNLADADLREANLEHVDLRTASLDGANLREANLKSANLSGASLAAARLPDANLRGANLRGASLAGADLEEANLESADLRKADLSSANLDGAIVSGAKFASADLANAAYAPASPPPDGYLEGLMGLDAVVVPYDDQDQEANVSGLVQLRELLREAGLRGLERQATYAIESGKTRYALARWRYAPLLALEGVFRVVFFDWPVAYGLHPGRALWSLLALIGLFAPIYLIALLGFGERSGIYRVWPKGGLEPTVNGARLRGATELEPLQLSGLVALGHALQFSLLSAFDIGWREFNIGSWLARMQTREYVLRALGWVRVAAGIQSLISVYLVAIWALTYFGRPFQ